MSAPLVRFLFRLQRLSVFARGRSLVVRVELRQVFKHAGAHSLAVPPSNDLTHLAPDELCQRPSHLIGLGVLVVQECDRIRISRLILRYPEQPPQAHVRQLQSLLSGRMSAKLPQQVPIGIGIAQQHRTACRVPNFGLLLFQEALVNVDPLAVEFELNPHPGRQPRAVRLQHLDAAMLGIVLFEQGGTERSDQRRFAHLVAAADDVQAGRERTQFDALSMDSHVFDNEPDEANGTVHETSLYRRMRFRRARSSSSAS